MFRNSSSRPAFNLSSGNFPFSAVQSRLRSTDGVSHKSLLTAAIHPANKLSFSALDPCSDSHLLCVSAVNPDWVDIWLTNFPPFQIDIRLFHNFFLVSIPHVSSLIASPLSNVSCPILARHSSVCCPIPTQPGHPAVRPYLSRMFCRTYSLFARLPLANSSVCWIVGPCGVLFAVVPRTANTQIQELQIPSIITFQTSHTACLHCTNWRQQQEFICAVKLADKNSLHPFHIRCGSIL